MCGQRKSDTPKAGTPILQDGYGYAAYRRAAASARPRENTIGRARQAASKLIAQHIDPAAEKQSRKAILHTNSVNTFEVLGHEWFS
jgi:hypothetical protein